MADFYQTGVVSTFHRFRSLDLEKIEKELAHFGAQRPHTLILPAVLFSIDTQKPKLWNPLAKVFK